MTTNELLMMFVALILGTQLCRFLPTFLPKKVLTAPILQKLNNMLPLVIMLLLLLTSLSLPSAESGSSLFVAQMIALIGVLSSYLWLKNTFLSVAIGIIGLNGVLWLIN